MVMFCKCDVFNLIDIARKNLETKLGVKIINPRFNY